MVQVKFIVEGKDDVQFLRELVSSITSDQIILDKKNDFFSIESNVNSINTKRTDLEKFRSQGFRNVVIMDADDSFGDFSHLLDGYVADGLIDAYFLLPNNSDQGELETLLLDAINPEHIQIFNCFDMHVQCIQNLSDAYFIPNLKNKIYSYSARLNERTDSKIDYSNGEHRRYKDANQWNLNHPTLNPLKAFLKANLGIE